MKFSGNLSAPILFITDHMHVHCLAEFNQAITSGEPVQVLSEYLGGTLFEAIRKVGLRQADFAMVSIHTKMGDTPLVDFIDLVAASKANVLVPLGEYALELVTGLKGIGKWQCSVLSAKAIFGGRKCIPLYHPSHVQTMYVDHVYYNVGCEKIARHKAYYHLNIPERKFVLNPDTDERKALIQEALSSPEIGVDFEFGRGQINTVGIAISDTQAFALKTLPEDYTEEGHYDLWLDIARVLESNVPKVIQHAAVEVSWAARYGVEIKNVVHDTMWAMKFLHPELEKGLDNVGRIYTPFPYWKDENQDWRNIRDWDSHLEYNCKDTTATLWAYREQKKALEARGLDKLFYGFVMPGQEVIKEMMNTGLRLDHKAIVRIKGNLEREQEHFQKIVDLASTAALGRLTNVRSPKQLRELFAAMGMKLSKGSHGIPSTDKKAITRLRRKYPDATVLPALIGISATNKRLSSYSQFEGGGDAPERMYFALDGCATETGGWGGKGSFWGTGVDPQSLPKYVRRCFIGDQETCLVELSLKQSEQRLLAYEGPDPKLIDLLESGADISGLVASRIFSRNEALVTRTDRRLADKVAYEASYGTGPRTFAEMCMNELSQHVEEKEAKAWLASCLSLFPGLRSRQDLIKKELYRARFLKTPIGRERHFFGRLNDQAFREAYRYMPQSVASDITSHLMLFLWKNRDHLGLAYEDQGRFLLKDQDYLLLQMRKERLGELVEACRDYKSWHPKLVLPGGTPIVPVDVKYGTNWKGMTKV